MIDVVVPRTADRGFEWLDVVNPTSADFDLLARNYGLHHTHLEDCLKPEHLAKFERYEDVTFLIVRSYDHEADPHADTVRALTRKIALFYGQTFIISVRRVDQPIFNAAFKALREHPEKLKAVWHVVINVLRASMNSYDEPLEAMMDRLEAMEAETFRPHGQIFQPKEGYQLTRTAAVVRRMLRGFLDILDKLDLPEDAQPYYVDVREDVEQHYFQANDLVENVNRILQLQISLVSHRTGEEAQRTNEVMRVLTVFSIFFLPLNYIAGVYGMNFEHMPELKEPLAYPIVLGAMGSVALGLFIYAKRKGWLKKSDY